MALPDLENLRDRLHALYGASFEAVSQAPLSEGGREDRQSGVGIRADLGVGIDTDMSTGDFWVGALSEGRIHRQLGLMAVLQASSYGDHSDVLTAANLSYGSSRLNGGVLGGRRWGPEGQESGVVGVEARIHPFLPLLLVPGLEEYAHSGLEVGFPIALSLQVTTSPDDVLDPSDWTFSGGIGIGF